MNEYLASAVDELYLLGVRDVVFSPGSRSTALAILFTAYKKFSTYMNLDERSAGFFALGLAKASRRPVVLVCTSGSAGAHYLPALAEAKHSRVPLIVITADRPAELRAVGAPQTMKQANLFGEFVAYYEELAAPTESTPNVYPRTVIQKAVLAATDVAPAPVHINVPVSEPLMPDTDESHFTMGRSQRGFRIIPGQMTAALPELPVGRRGLFLCGPDYRGDSYAADIVKLAEAWQVPILADPLSPVRRFTHSHIIDSYDAFLSSDEVKADIKPDFMVLFGQIPVSKRVQQFMRLHNDVLCVQVDPAVEYRNAALTTNVVVRSDVALFCREALAQMLPTDVTEATAYTARWQEYQRRMRTQLSTVASEPFLFEGRIISLLQKQMPKDSRLLAANSMTIRDMDYFWTAGSADVELLGNRGVNGIDGTVSTALGIAAAGKRTVMVTGDLSFLHDMNGLIMGKTHRIPLVIVLFNNDGGGIFEYLPQRESPHFDYLFATPHGLDFSGLAQLTGLRYCKAESYEAFNRMLAEALSGDDIYLIEVPTDRARSRELHRKYTVMR